MLKNKNGFSVIEAVIILAVIGGLGFAGYTVLGKNKTTTKTTPSKSSTVAKTETWKEVSSAVPGTYADADVVKVNDTTYRMYYAIQPEVKGNQFEVYSSTSTDGKTWAQDPGTRKTFATFPAVVKLSDGRYRMYFQSASVLKSAISTDGLTFTDEAGTRIDKENSDNLTLDNVAAPTVLLKDDGTYVMVYRGTINARYAADTPNTMTNLLMWATSADGLTFTKKGIAVDSRNSTLRGQLDGPYIVKWDDGSTRVYVTNYNGVYMYKFDGTKFSGETLAFSLSSGPAGGYGIPPGDPTLAKIGGTWFMYYGATGSKSGIYYATMQ